MLADKTAPEALDVHPEDRGVMYQPVFGSERDG